MIFEMNKKFNITFSICKLNADKRTNPFSTALMESRERNCHKAKEKKRKIYGCL
jgi:hypothetical protein